MTIWNQIILQRNYRQEKEKGNELSIVKYLSKQIFCFKSASSVFCFGVHLTLFKAIRMAALAGRAGLRWCQGPSEDQSAGTHGRTS